MKEEDFLYEITARFNMYGSTSAGVQLKPEYKFILKDYKDFAEKNRGILAEVMRRLCDNYEYNSPPKKAVLNKLAATIYDESDTRQAEDDRAIESSPIVQCWDCKTLYDKKSVVCPKCLCHDRNVVKAVSELEYLKVQADCYRCKVYKGEGQIFGPVCINYGRIKAALEVKKDPHPCSVCKCRDCCEAESLYREDPKAYKRKYEENFTTPAGVKIYQDENYTPYWIDKNIPVLGK